MEHVDATTEAIDCLQNLLDIAKREKLWGEVGVKIILKDGKPEMIRGLSDLGKKIAN